MENQSLPRQPQPLAELKKWYQHKGVITILILALIVGVVVCVYFILNQPKSIEPFVVNHKQINPSPITVQEELKIWDDQTAYVRGQVKEHNFGCSVDGACYLRLLVNNEEVRIIYNEGDVPQTCVNNQADHAQSIKEGDWIKAFGAYSKRGNIIVVATCGSADYFIRYADEGTPLGRVTERFFDEVAKAKGEVGKKQFEEAQKSGVRI